MMNLFDNNLLCGYNISCRFSRIANNSVLVGPKKVHTNLKIVCNSFHGHVHCCICQLEHHPMYILGAGIEDFEGCKRFFSESNRIALCTRHVMKFYCCQAILCHFTCWNRDKYAEISEYTQFTCTRC